jgi:DNA-binding NtrC family response regulator
MVALQVLDQAGMGATVGAGPSEAIIQVLVVDPDPGTGDAVRGALPGADVRRVDSVYEALGHVAAHAVDVIVTERLLPGASYDDLLVRLERGDHRLPVVLCSHRQAPVDHAHPFVRCVLTKPVDLSALRAALLAATADASLR